MNVARQPSRDHHREPEGLDTSILTGHSALVPNAEEMSEFALRLASEATDRMIDFIRSDLPSFEEAVEACMMPLREFVHSDEPVNSARNSQWRAAHDLLEAARAVVYPIEPKPVDEVDPDTGYRLIAEHHYAEACAFADSLMQQAANLCDPDDPDDRPDDDDVHHANIIRGKAHLAQGDAAAGAAALLAAGDVQGSPVLGSFGPDLSLAWDLLRAGQDDAVIEYLRRVSRFWSPRDRVRSRSSRSD